MNHSELMKEVEASVSDSVICGNMSRYSAVARLKQDYVRIKQEPVPYVTAEPLPSDMLEWHYVIMGPEQTPYEGGIYHGKLVFPLEFPFKPPSFYMITPNGRFECNTRLCLSISDFEPDTWNPAWSVSAILTGLLSFMVKEEPTFGSIETSNWEKQLLARKSGEFNLGSQVFCELFPDIAQEIRIDLERRWREELDQEYDVRRNGFRKSEHSVQKVVKSKKKESKFPGGTFSKIIVMVGCVAVTFTVGYFLRSRLR